MADNLAAQLGTNRTTCTGHHYGFLVQTLCNNSRIRPNRVTPQQVFNFQIPNVINPRLARHQLRHGRNRLHRNGKRLQLLQQLLAVNLRMLIQCQQYPLHTVLRHMLGDVIDTDDRQAIDHRLVVGPVERYENHWPVFRALLECRRQLHTRFTCAYDGNRLLRHLFGVVHDHSNTQSGATYKQESQGAIDDGHRARYKQLQQVAQNDQGYTRGNDPIDNGDKCSVTQITNDCPVQPKADKHGNGKHHRNGSNR